MSKNGPSSDSVEALDRSPSHLLHRALQLALDLYADEAAPGAPTQRQYAVLSAVAAREGLNQTDLVRATGIDRSTLADLVARMIAKGLLARERSSADGRANTVHLSELGRAALAEAAPRVAAADARLLDRLGKTKRAAFLAGLHALARAGDKALSKAEKADGAPSEAEATADAAEISTETAGKPRKVKVPKDKPGKAAKDRKKKKKKAATAAAADAAA